MELRQEHSADLSTRDINGLLQSYFHNSKFKRTCYAFTTEAAVTHAEDLDQEKRAQLFLQLINKGLYYSVFE